MQIMTVTGYKTFELGIFSENDERIIYIKEAIRRRLMQFIEEGLEWVLISGQLGLELWAGEVVLALKEEGFEIKLGVVPPFNGQSKRWQEEVQVKYEEICTLADFYQPIYNDEYKGPYQFQAKNNWLIQKTEGCLILLDEENHGSVKYFYDAALSKQSAGEYEVHYITPFDLDDIVSDMAMFDNEFN